MSSAGCFHQSRYSSSVVSKPANGDECVERRALTETGPFLQELLTQKWQMSDTTHSSSAHFVLVPNMMNRSQCPFVQLNSDSEPQHSSTGIRAPRSCEFLKLICHPCLNQTHPRQLQNPARPFSTNSSIMGPSLEPQNSRRKAGRAPWRSPGEETTKYPTLTFQKAQLPVQNRTRRGGRCGAWSSKCQTHRPASYDGCHQAGQSGTCPGCCTGSANLKDSKITGQNPKRM